MKKDKFCINIYKLNKLLSREEIMNHLNSKIEDRDNLKIVDNSSIINKKTEIIYFSYTIEHIRDYDVKWHEKWCDFFDLNKPLKSLSTTGHGLIFIQNREKEYGYILVFGRAFSMVKELIVYDYGISMADKLFDGKSASAISGKYYSMIRNKSLEDFYEGSTMRIADGEAIDLLKSNVVEDASKLKLGYITELLKYINKQITIRYGYIQLTLEREKIKVTDIENSLFYLHQIELRYTSRFFLPRMHVVKKEKSVLLDDFLLDYLKTGVVIGDVNQYEAQISVPIFFKDDSNIDIFLSSISNIRIFYGRKNYIEGKTISHEDICKFMSDYKIKDIRKVKIRLTSEIGDVTFPLMDWIDTQLEIENNHKVTSYVLYDGKWCTYNKAYIEKINQKVEEYEKRVVEIDESFSVSQVELNNYFKLNNDKLRKAFSSENSSIPYREYIYNYILSTKNDWILFDRKMYNSVEICDLEIKHKAHIHVKFGKLSNLEEALRQSIRGERMYNNEMNNIFKMIKSHDNKTMSRGKVIGVLFLNDYRIRAISSSKSLKLKQTFLDWVEEMENIKKQCKIVLAEYKEVSVFNKNLWERLNLCSFI